jgi:hypothetical protein
MQCETHIWVSCYRIYTFKDNITFKSNICQTWEDNPDNLNIAKHLGKIILITLTSRNITSGAAHHKFHKLSHTHNHQHLRLSLNKYTISQCHINKQYTQNNKTIIQTYHKRFQTNGTELQQINKLFSQHISGICGVQTYTDACDEFQN